LKGISGTGGSFGVGVIGVTVRLITFGVLTAIGMLVVTGTTLIFIIFGDFTSVIFVFLTYEKIKMHMSIMNSIMEIM